MLKQHELTLVDFKANLIQIAASEEEIGLFYLKSGRLSEAVKLLLGASQKREVSLSGDN